MIRVILLEKLRIYLQDKEVISIQQIWNFVCEVFGEMGVSLISGYSYFGTACVYYWYKTREGEFIKGTITVNDLQQIKQIQKYEI